MEHIPQSAAHLMAFFQQRLEHNDNLRCAIYTSGFSSSQYAIPSGFFGVEKTLIEFFACTIALVNREMESYDAFINEKLSIY